MDRGRAPVFQRGVDEADDHADVVEHNPGDPGRDCVAYTELTNDAIEFPPLDGTLPNAARATWFVKRASDTSDETRITVGLYHQKANLGPLRRAVGFDIAFSDTATTIKRIDLADVDELAGSLPLWQRMKHALSSGPPQTAVALAEELGRPNEDDDARKRRTETISRTARRLKQVFTRVTGADGVHRIALVSNRAA